jgi:hypothetical protein
VWLFVAALDVKLALPGTLHTRGPIACNEPISLFARRRVRQESLTGLGFFEQHELRSRLPWRATASAASTDQAGVHAAQTVGGVGGIRGLRGGGGEQGEGLGDARATSGETDQAQNAPLPEGRHEISSGEGPLLGLHAQERQRWLSDADPLQSSDAEIEETESRLAHILTHSPDPHSDENEIEFDDPDRDLKFLLRLNGEAAPGAPVAHDNDLAPRSSPRASQPEQEAWAGARAGEQPEAAPALEPPTYTITPWSPAKLEALGVVLPASEDYPSNPLLVEDQRLLGAGSEFQEGEWSLKTALANVSVHGSRLDLLPGDHGPFNTVHSFPEEHDTARVWADPLVMSAPCHIAGGFKSRGKGDVGRATTRVEATLIILCGTVGVGPCMIRDVEWMMKRASCIYIFGGEWTISSCDIRCGHPAGDGIYCKGTSRVPLPRRYVRRKDGTEVPVKYAKFPPVRLAIKQCSLGGLRVGTPTGWGVTVCERAQLSMEQSVVEYCHQALSVVDWCRATVSNSSLRHTGNAVWFGNRCEVRLRGCRVLDTLAAFSLRTTWDQGRQCMSKDQDVDDGRHARLSLERCHVESNEVFEGQRQPGTFLNHSNTFVRPTVAPNASLVRPALPYIKDPVSYHLKNTARSDLTDIQSFGADPSTIVPNPDYGMREPWLEKETNGTQVVTAPVLHEKSSSSAAADDDHPGFCPFLPLRALGLCALPHFRCPVSRSFAFQDRTCARHSHDHTHTHTRSRRACDLPWNGLRVESVPVTIQRMFRRSAAAEAGFS